MPPAPPPTKPERVKLYRPFTGTEEVLVELLGEGMALAEVARALHVTEMTARSYVLRASRKIPGTVPPLVRIPLWWRGCSLEILSCCASGHRSDTAP